MTVKPAVRAPTERIAAFVVANRQRIDPSEQSTDRARAADRRAAASTYASAMSPQRIVVVLVYADVAAARDFLVDAFGFEVGRTHRDDHGHLEHLEMTLYDEVIRLHPVAPDHGLASIAELGSATGTLHIVVDDVDDHHLGATTAGAVIVSSPADQPGGHRGYSAYDSEGRIWSFTSPT